MADAASGGVGLWSDGTVTIVLSTVQAALWTRRRISRKGRTPRTSRPIARRSTRNRHERGYPSVLEERQAIAASEEPDMDNLLVRVMLAELDRVPS